ncbi:response regulator [Herbiconiux sp. A18JL235]|uniref:Response regulator n=1 Tax=Herbiconiux sp. A18JL235 TaxID=3152363 RepID=A0AB39BI81_9MICO
MIRVAVVDDQAIVRDGLVTVLGLLDGIEVVGEAEDGLAALELVASAQPDVVLMDLRMPRLDGAAATRRIVQEHPGTAVLVLTTFADDESIAQALGAGARGYLTKDAGRQQLEAAVRAVASGQTTLSPLVRDAVLSGVSRGGTSAAAVRRRIPALTEREAEVLGLIADGCTNTEIAARLVLSVATVKSHVNAVFAKLGVETRAQAVARVLQG